MTLNRFAFLCFFLMPCLYAQAQDSTKHAVELKEITVNTKRRNLQLNTRNHKPLLDYTGASGSLEQVLRWMPGVSSSNELSAQYHVRGGSFDENLVYLNGIELYRPLMSRTAQQEGLSIIHPDLVSSLEFSAGGFGAEYGDKMSSVLTVNYRKPTGTEGAVSTSLLGSSVYLGSKSPNGRWHALFGARYKTSNYLLNSLDEKGTYLPRFLDIQTAISYQARPQLDFHLLAAFGNNTYTFTPESRETDFGTLDQPRKFIMYYEGSESDQYQQAMFALGMNYRNDHSVLSLSLAWTRICESETYDILGAYRLRDIEGGLYVPSPTETMNADIGGIREHARNFLNSDVLNLSHQGSSNLGPVEWNWGAGLQWMQVNDHLNQWRMIDSAGYTLPQSLNEIRTDQYARGEHFLSQWQAHVYSQWSRKFSIGNQVLGMRIGGRVIYTNRNREWIFSPRCDIDWNPSWGRGLRIFAAGGNYAQPLFYREMRDPSGGLHPRLKAQQAWHTVLGASFPFEFERIRYQLSAEFYNKQLRNIIPYRMDNLRLEYAGENCAEGEIWGMDLRLNAQLLPDAESWINVSFLNAKQRINQGARTPMPNDQLIFASIFFQDYLPSYPLLRVQAMMNFGSGLPAQRPQGSGYDAYSRLPSYRRVDLGCSYEIYNSTLPSALLYPLRRHLLGIKTISAGVEAMNLFGFINTASYLWVKTLAQGGVGGGWVAVPNYLSPLRINLKLSVRF